MRYVNLVIIFALCLAVVVFGLENTDAVRIVLLPGRSVTTPLAIALLVTAGVGATVAWVFSLWMRLLRRLEGGSTARQLRARDEQIKALSQDLETVKTELDRQRQQPLLSANEDSEPADPVSS